MYFYSFTSYGVTYSQHLSLFVFLRGYDQHLYSTIIKFLTALFIVSSCMCYLFCYSSLVSGT